MKMNSKKFLKYLKSIGIDYLTDKEEELKISLDEAFEDDSIKEFFDMLASECNEKNNLHEYELAVEAQILKTDFIKAEDRKTCTKPTYSVLDEEIKNINSALEREKLHFAALQSTNSLVQMSIDEICVSIDSKKKFNKQLLTTEATIADGCKERNNQLFRDITELVKNCQKLWNVACSSSPQNDLIYQIPLNFQVYMTERKEFDKHVANYIIHQFEKRTAILAGENEPSTCMQSNPCQLHHLVKGPDKQQYTRQCKDMDFLQLRFSKTLAELSVLEAETKGLKAVISRIQCGTNSCNNDSDSSSYPDKELLSLEVRVRGAAKDCAARKVEFIMLGNYMVKQRRQEYYLECMHVLEQLLLERLALDKLLLFMLMVESSLVDDASTFIDSLGNVATEETNKLLNGLANIDQAKREWNPASKLPPVDALVVLTEDFTKECRKPSLLETLVSLDQQQQDLDQQLVLLSIHNQDRLREGRRAQQVLQQYVGHAAVSPILAVNLQQALHDLQPKLDSFIEEIYFVLAEYKKDQSLCTFTHLSLLMSLGTRPTKQYYCPEWNQVECPKNVLQNRMQHNSGLLLLRKIWSLFVARPDAISEVTVSLKATANDSNVADVKPSLSSLRLGSQH